MTHRREPEGTATNLGCRISVADVGFLLSDQHHSNLRSRSISAALAVFHLIGTASGTGRYESRFSSSVEHHSGDSVEQCCARHRFPSLHYLDFGQTGRGRYRYGNRFAVPRREFFLQGDTSSNNGRRNQRPIHVEPKDLHSMVTGEGDRIQQREPGHQGSRDQRDEDLPFWLSRRPGEISSRAQATHTSSHQSGRTWSFQTAHFLRVAQHPRVVFHQASTDNGGFPQLLHSKLLPVYSH
jgi:hypothetical protein